MGQDARDAPREANATIAEGKPDPTLEVSLDCVSFTGLKEPLEAIAADHFVSAPACGVPHRNVTYGASVNLTRLREITHDLAELFGLALPDEKAMVRGCF